MNTVHNKRTTHWISQKLASADFKEFQIKNEGNIKEIDEKLNTSVTGQEYIDVFIEKIDCTIQSTCKKTFNYLNSPNTTLKGEPVP